MVVAGPYSKEFSLSLTANKLPLFRQYETTNFRCGFEIHQTKEAARQTPHPSIHTLNRPFLSLCVCVCAKVMKDGK